jgi:predicted CXXCH cytochrome family protein
MYKRIPQLSFYLPLLLATSLNIGCSPRTSYKVLSVFFDGVPDSLSTTGQTAPAKLENKDSLMLAAIANLETGPKYVYHAPYQKQECDKCHDKVVRSSLLQPQPGLCYTCHSDFKNKFAYLHGPVASGNCSSCHAPHLSENNGLLRITGQALCYYCHHKDDVVKNGAHRSVLNDDCTKCHDPHGGTNRYVLKQ